MSNKKSSGNTGNTSAPKAQAKVTAVVKTTETVSKLVSYGTQTIRNSEGSGKKSK